MYNTYIEYTVGTSMNNKLLIGLLCITFSPTAFAYIDPGSGAYIIQAVIALFGAAAFYLRHPIESIKALIRKILGK